MNMASSAKVKNFLRQMVKVKEMHLEKDIAHKTLEKQIHKVKSASASRSQNKLDDELRKLHQAVTETLEKERAILQLQREDSEIVVSLRNKVKELESRLVNESKYSQKLDNVLDAINKLHIELVKNAEEKKRRERRVSELEGRIKSKLDTGNKEILVLEDNIKTLEKRYKLLLQKGERANINNIKERIGSLKQRLEEMKQR